MRLLGQLGDGVFQASLAGAVLFNPERQAHAADVAAGFAVVLVPYSLVGPFAGVLIDRWRRQRVIVGSNLLRAGCVLLLAVEVLGGLHGLPFYASALVVVSLSRFFLSGLSASLPHVVGADDLVTANALATTGGAIATTIGGAGAIAARALIGSSDGDYAVIAVAAALCYALSALPGRGFGPDELGPDDVERTNRETMRDVSRGLLDGARHVHERKPVLYALVAIGIHRLCYGVTTVCTLLLYRNYFHDEGFFRAGLSGLGQVVGAVAIGGGLAAIVTPVAARHLGYVRWPAMLLIAAAVVEAGLGLPYTMPLLLLAALLLGFVSQAIKISVDTLVQQQVADLFRGRVFALYDTLFNLTLVAAAVLTAVALPEDGYTPTTVVVIAVVYALVGIGYARLGERVSEPAARTTA
ncbi:MAG: Major Facilitator Superfamily protein [Pseudonocardiales bacterium]|nr:Major Facilitator Superfamily protein [Pseudonocardiales bacterium]